MIRLATIPTHRSIDTERMKRHMMRSTGDTLILPRPWSSEDEEANRARFERWVSNWKALHPQIHVPAVYQYTDATRVHFQIRGER
jgi:hypothetical protein